MHEFPLTHGAAMRYLDLPGDGLPVLFIHGLGCAGSADYPEVAASPALQGHRAIIVDLPGAGFSDRPDGWDCSVTGHALTLARFVESLGLARLALYGHSAGGPVAIELTEALPDAVAALVIGEGNLDAGGGTISRAIAAAGSVPRMNVATATRLPKSVVRAAGGVPSWEAMLRTASPAALLAWASSLVEGGTPSWRDWLYGLAKRLPVTYLFGALSLPDSDVDELGRHGVRVEVIPDVGHQMAWQGPDALAGAIARALSSASSAIGN